MVVPLLPLSVFLDLIPPEPDEDQGDEGARRDEVGRPAVRHVGGVDEHERDGGCQ